MKFWYNILTGLFAASAMLSSCSLSQKGENRDGENTAYHLRLDPADGSRYKYTISNSSTTAYEAEGKESEYYNSTEAEIQFVIQRDSGQHIILETSYSSLVVESKNEEGKSEIKVNAETIPFTPMEKMLKVLKDAKLLTTMSPAGEVLRVQGLDSMENRLMLLFADADHQLREQVRSQWRMIAKEGIFRKNLDQMFRLFPDSVVKLGDSWKLTSRDEGPLSVNVTNTFTLKALNEKIAIVHSGGKLRSDNEPAVVMGFQQAKVDVTGEQEGEFELETDTGMLISCRLKVKMKGDVMAMGRVIPINITTDIRIKGNRIF